MSSSKQSRHAPWKLHRIIGGHDGGVRCCTVEQNNKFFATGSDDGVIKIWDLKSGKLKTSLNHILKGSIRGLGYSSYDPFLYSCGENGQLKCWDVEYNKLVHEYEGHESTVNSLIVSILLLTIGRDCSARSWELRSSYLIRTYVGHTAEVSSFLYRDENIDIITGGRDCTVRVWKLSSPVPQITLINHKKNVKALVLNSAVDEIVSASQDSVKKWTGGGELIQNMPKCNATINCLATNANDVLVSGTDDGRMQFWDWQSGHIFQTLRSPVLPGSKDSESDIFSVTFDMTGTKLITTGADKMIKIYKQDQTASQ